MTQLDLNRWQNPQKTNQSQGISWNPSDPLSCSAQFVKIHHQFLPAAVSSGTLFSCTPSVSSGLSGTVSSLLIPMYVQYHVFHPKVLTTVCIVPFLRHMAKTKSSPLVFHQITFKQLIGIIRCTIPVVIVHVFYTTSTKGIHKAVCHTIHQRRSLAPDSWYWPPPNWCWWT